MKYALENLIKPKKGDGKGIRANLKARKLSSFATGFLKMLEEAKGIRYVTRTEAEKELNMSQRDFHSAIQSLRRRGNKIEKVAISKYVYGYELCDEV